VSIVSFIYIHSSLFFLSFPAVVIMARENLVLTYVFLVILIYSGIRMGICNISLCQLSAYERPSNCTRGAFSWCSCCVSLDFVALSLMFLGRNLVVCLLVCWINTRFQIQRFVSVASSLICHRAQTSLVKHSMFLFD
jgi:hypothetical protein